MIVTVDPKTENANGLSRSFKGLALYLQHGERDDPKPERAEWVFAYNCECSDPAEAWREMAWEAKNQSEIKAMAKAAGRLPKNARTDQVEELPNWHCVVSWDIRDNPTKERMLEVAEALLIRFGFHSNDPDGPKHKAQVTCHRDGGEGGSVHIHISASVIDPRTGKSIAKELTHVKAGKYGLQTRLSEFALEQEQANPQERAAPQRAKNWEQRRETSRIFEAWKRLCKVRRAAGRVEPPKPERPRAYDRSPAKHVYKLMQQARRVVLDVMRGQPDAPAVAQHTAEKFAATHRKAASQQFEKEKAATKAKAANTGARKPGNAEVAAVLKRVTHLQSVFGRKELQEAVKAELGKTAAPGAIKELMAAVEDSDELVRAHTKDGRPRMTTRTMIETETRLVGGAIIMANSQTHKVADRHVQEALAANIHLNDQQRAALEHVTSPAGLACVIGFAGAGKSTMLRGAHQAWQAAGYNVTGLAYSGLAAQSLQDGSGIQSKTVAAIEWAMQHQGHKFGPRDVIVIDEAGMLGSRQLCRMLDHAREAGAKVVLVGDYQQLQAIEAGGAFRAIVQDPTIGAAEISTVIRQGSHLEHGSVAWRAYEWQREATKHLAGGRVGDALEAYRSRGYVHEHESREDARAAMVAAWFADSRLEGKSSIMLAGTRDAVRDLNEDAREIMKGAGLLGAGRVIAAVEEVPDEKPRDFKLKVATGDRLMFTKNDKRLGVKNGTLGTLEGIEGGRLLILIDGKEKRRVSVDLAEYRNFAYGYAATVHKTQGVTVDRAHVFATTNMDAHAAYVALSRHREAVSLVYSKEDFASASRLEQKLSRQRLKETTLDLITAREIGELQRMVFGDDMKRLMKYGAELIARNKMRGRSGHTSWASGVFDRSSRRGRDSGRQRE